jgi:hypothetical protein
MMVDSSHIPDITGVLGEPAGSIYHAPNGLLSLDHFGGNQDSLPVGVHDLDVRVSDFDARKHVHISVSLNHLIVLRSVEDNPR